MVRSEYLAIKSVTCKCLRLTDSKQGKGQRAETRAVSLAESLRTPQDNRQRAPAYIEQWSRLTEAEEGPKGCPLTADPWSTADRLTEAEGRAERTAPPVRRAARRRHPSRAPPVTAPYGQRSDFPVLDRGNPMPLLARAQAAFQNSVSDHATSPAQSAGGCG